MSRRSVDELELEVARLQEANRALTGAKAIADAANSAKSAFLANMSHEIRTPMNGVLGMAELLLSTSLDASQDRIVNTIRRSADALLEVINDLLDFSKVEADRLELEHLEFDLRELVEDVVELLAPTARAKGITLVSAIERKTSTRFVGDSTRVRQIVTNLVANAIKFTHQGHVLVRVAVRSGDGGPRVTVAVEDTGIGIDAASLARLFEPFVQADGSTTRRYGGTGLGLAIAKRLCSLMGGEIIVDTEPGRGSTFTCTLALEPRSGAAVATALVGRRALVVRSDAAGREALVEGLSDLGFTVRDASSEANARAVVLSAIADGGGFDVCFVDELFYIGGIAFGGQLPLGDTTVLRVVTSGPTRARPRDLCEPVRRWRLLAASARALGVAGGGSSEMRRPATVAPRPFVELSVLLAEDNQINRDVASAMLEQLGCRVAIAADGREACRRIEEGSFDAVFMDCQMPELDGFDATRFVRQREQVLGGHVPIIALTANALAGDRERCLAAGMDEFVSKPFHKETLRSALARVLARDSLAIPIATRATVAPRRGPSAIDPAPIETIRRLQRPGKPDLLAATLEIYLRTTPQELDTVVRAAQSGDVALLGRAAHRLKGSSRTVGATRVAELLAALEAETAGATSTGSNARLAELQVAHDDAMRDLRAALATTKKGTDAA